MDLEELETCVLCGGEVDPEFGEEVSDGWICEDCAACISPWMQDLDIAETDDLEEQLRLREENQENLESFRPTRSFYLPGMTEKLFLDDETRTFLVTEGFQIRQENPDIITLDQVIDATVEVEDDREELEDGLYLYSYNLSLRIELDHPYLTEISFALHPEALTYESSEKSFLGFGGFDPEEEPDYQNLASFGQDIADALTDMEDEINHKYDVRPGEFDLGAQLEEEYEEEEVPEEEEEIPEEELQDGDIVVCPWCGCRTHVNGRLICEHCGGTL